MSLDSLGSNQLSGLNDFLVSLGRKGNIYPPSELVFQVPSGFSMSNQHQSVLVGSLDGSETEERKIVGRNE